MTPAMPPLPDLALIEQQVREVNAAARESHAHVMRVHADITRNSDRLREEFLRPNRAPPSNLPARSDRNAVLPRPVEYRKRVTYRWPFAKLLAASLGGLLLVTAISIPM